MFHLLHNRGNLLHHSPTSVLEAILKPIRTACIAAGIVTGTTEDRYTIQVSVTAVTHGCKADKSHRRSRYRLHHRCEHRQSNQAVDKFLQYKHPAVTV